MLYVYIVQYIYGSVFSFVYKYLKNLLSTLKRFGFCDLSFEYINWLPCFQIMPSMTTNFQYIVGYILSRNSQYLSLPLIPNLPLHLIEMFNFEYILGQANQYGFSSLYWGRIERAEYESSFNVKTSALIVCLMKPDTGNICNIRYDIVVMPSFCRWHTNNYCLLLLYKCRHVCELFCRLRCFIESAFHVYY